MNNTPITLIQIARALSLSPGTLSNWQKRYDDFPEPAQVLVRRRLYLLEDVQAFMQRHGLKTGDVNAAVDRKVSDEQRLVNYLSNELRDTTAIGPEMIHAIAAAAFRLYPQLNEFRKNHGEPHSIENDLAVGAQLLWQESVNEMPIDISRWNDAPHSVDPIKFAEALRQYLRKISGRQFGGQYTTAPSVARLLSKIANGLDVLDMCSGYGNLLREYHRGSHRLVGQEINGTVASISRILAFLEGYAVEIHNEDAIATFHPEWISNGFDAIAIDPPMGVRIHDDQINPNDLRWTFKPQTKVHHADDFWIQSALAYLRSSSIEISFRAALHLRSGWFFDGSEGPMRDALLKSGVVEAVIALGSGASAGSGITTNILVLRKVGTVLNSVRMIDAREAGHLVNGQRSYSNQEIDSIVAALKNYGSSSNNSTIKVLDVSLQEILENGSVLSVNRYITEAQQVKKLDESIRIFDDSIKALESVISKMGSVINQTDARPLALIKEKFDSEFRNHPLNQSGTDNALIDTLFKNRPQGSEWNRDLIFPDDIVVCTAGVQVGQAVTGHEFLARRIQWSKVWILRIRSYAVNPRYLETWAKYGGLEIQIRPYVSGSTVPMLAKRDLDRVEIPIPSPATQDVIALWGDMVTNMINVFTNFGDLESEFLESIKGLGASFFNDINKQGGQS